MIIICLFPFSFHFGYIFNTLTFCTLCLFVFHLAVGFGAKTHLFSSAAVIWQSVEIIFYFRYSFPFPVLFPFPFFIFYFSYFFLFSAIWWSCTRQPCIDTTIMLYSNQMVALFQHVNFFFLFQFNVLFRLTQIHGQDVLFYSLRILPPRSNK